MEGGGQVQGGVVQRQAMQRGPEVENIAMHGAVCLEALKDVFAEMGGERVLAVGGVAVYGTRPTSLLAAAVQLLEEAEMAQHLFEGDLAAQEGVVHMRA